MIAKKIRQLEVNDNIYIGPFKKKKTIYLGYQTVIL